MKKWILLILSVLVLIAIAFGLLTHFVFVSPVASVQNKPIGANVAVTGSRVPSGIKAVVSSVRSPFSMRPLGPTVEISPTGKIHGVPITLRFKLDKPVSGEEVLLAVRESPSSEWMLMKPVVSQDGWYASVTTDHLSLWQPLWYDVKQAISDFREFFLNGLSGDLFTQAKPPTCENQSQARGDGYTIDSSAKATLFWCFGIEDGSRVLKIVNHESYPLEVVHPGLTVKHIDSWSLELDQLARIGSGKTSILYPFEEEDFTLDLKPGAKAGVSTEFSGYAQGLYQIEVGVEALQMVLSRFGLDKNGIAKLFTATRWHSVAKDMESFLHIKDCANAMGPLLDPKPDAGKLISGCFEPAEVVEALGWKGWLLAPIMAVGSILEFFRSELTAIVDLGPNRDKYEIHVHRLTPGTVTTYEVSDSVLGDITAGPDGNLWFTASRVTNSGRIGWIGRITQDGQVTAFSLPSSVANRDPGAITDGPDGNLWFVLPGSMYFFPAPAQGPVLPGQIGLITTGGVVKVFPAATATSSPVFLATGPDGNVWFTDMNGSIGRITPDGQITEFPVPNALLYAGIAVGADGNMWFTTGGTIGRITLNGKVTLFQETADPCPGVCDFRPGPPKCDLVAGPDGHLWFTDDVNGYIGRITLNGSITRFPANGAPMEITAGPDGNLWFTIQDNPLGVVGRITSDGSITFPVPDSQGYGLGGITTGPDGNLWFTGQTSEGGGIIVRMTQ